MKTPDEIRAELDNVTPLRPKDIRHTKPGKAEQPAQGEPSTIWADDIELRLDQASLVEGLLSTTAMTVLYGESGSGKTFAAIDLGCHIAAGLAWRRLAVEQGIVIYVAAEAPESVKRRIWAWKQRHEVAKLPVLVVQSTVDLLNGDAEALATMLERLKVEHGRIALVIVDTLARAMTGNENAPDDMGRFVGACARLREAGETHVLVVHHSGKDVARGARGHSSLRAATDVELEVTNGEDGGAVRVTKHRDEAGGSAYGFKLDVVELGLNSQGRMITTCVLAEGDVPQKKSKPDSRPPRLNDKGKIFVQALERAIKDEGTKPPYHAETRGVSLAVTDTVARTYWRQTIGWDDADRLARERSRNDWKRGLESAIATKAVSRWGDYLWLS